MPQGIPLAAREHAPESALLPFFSDSLFWIPDCVDEASAWIEHIPFAFWIMEALEPNCFVELGTHTGVSYLAFCQAAQQLGMGARGYAVDTWRGDEHTGLYGEEVFQKLSEIHDRRYASFSRLVRATFDEAVRHFENGSIDLLHIDGVHTYETVKHDVETWKPKLAPRAVVLLHDTNVREGDFGVFRLWRELAPTHPHFEFLHGHGLGVLGVGSTFPSPVAALFSASSQPQTASRIRELFARFGAQLSALPGHAAQRESSARDARIADLEGAVAARQADAQRLSSELAAKEARADELQRELSSQISELQHLRDALLASETRVEDLERALAAQEMRVEEVGRAPSTCRGKRAHASSLVTAQDEQIVQSRSMPARQGAQDQRFSTEIAQRATEPEKLKRRLSLRAGSGHRWIVRGPKKIVKALRNAVRVPLRFVCLPISAPIRSLALRRRTLTGLAWLLPRSDRRLISDVWLLRETSLFDKRWYLEHNPDIAKGGKDPVVHYVRSGARKGRNPGPLFDGNWYVAHNPDVAALGMNPLVHYLRYGAAEGRSATRASSPSGELPSYSGEMRVPDALRYRFPALQPIRAFFVAGAPRQLTMITDSINKGSLYGGVATAMIFASLLANRLDAALRIVTRNEPPEQANFQKVISLHGIEWQKNVDFRYLNLIDNTEEIDVGEHDVFLTTSWWTTWSARRAFGPKKIIYLLQEDERMFYPGGDEQLCCIETLSDPDIRFVINSELLYEHFLAEGFRNIEHNGLWFEPSFPASSYFMNTHRTAGNKNLFFYARPNNVRNLYYRGLEAVNAALEQDILTLNEWDIYFVGKDLPANMLLARNVRPEILQNLEWAEYAALARTIDVGLSLMLSPHPSYPPLDLAASGAVVVTNRYGRKQSLDRYSKNILCVGTTVDELVKGIAEAVELANDGSRRRENYASSHLMRDWSLSFDPVLRRLAAS